MDDERMREAVDRTREQIEQAAGMAASLLRKGADKLKDAADAASAAIRDDLNKRS